MLYSEVIFVLNFKTISHSNIHNRRKIINIAILTSYHTNLDRIFQIDRYN